ncbi:chromosome segregation ATPase [Trichocoleus sp. FACHB-591]|uniref:chromosome segregation ATPase n=1 Tax=Trichocoleus sp. FACHB-591 TaxID=2692872 RepID=UPI001686DF27|nr:chromosome segregation ATPase [Trichocoleus sp. FACHB-591]MBD2097881.1 chromosome segregation ATPase [Trichocoleus sp. FACHB-591]
MTRDRGTPDRRPADRPLRIKNSSNPDRPPAPRPSTHPTPRPVVRAVPPDPVRPVVSTLGQTEQPAYAVPGSAPPPLTQPPSPRDRRRLRLPTSIRFWGLTTLLLTGGAAVVSVALLVRSPALPNCPSIFWPMASASMRLYCAQVAANKQTVKNLLEAIALVHNLPLDHPLRSDIDRSIQQWSSDILNLAETSFNAGKLEEAIATARKIPENTSAHALVNERIERWQLIWEKAEAIYQKSEAAMRERKWHQAFTEAVRLLYVGNTYWETTKYQELNERIRVAKEEGNKLAKAEELADIGGLDNLLKAIKLAESISPNSYIYKEAQTAIAKFGRKMLNLAQATLEERNATEAIAIARKIPDSANLEEEAQDFIDLADAQAQAWQGTVADLEAAIAQAQKLDRKRPMYARAQQLITRWQREIEGVAHLDRARQLAQGGTPNALGSAIAEASLVNRSNPRWDEAQKEIARWRGQIETTEDRPYLDRADEYALAGDANSLQSAINEASQVGPGRALYGEAQDKIRQWTREIQRQQDQPYLDQARAFASSGDLTSAIATADQITSGRALYDEAQDEIRSWRSLIQAEQNWQEAQSLATAATPDALAAAIQKADQIPASSSLRIDAEAAINQWSQSILVLAQNQANYDLPSAIAIAQKVPARTEAYAQAQLQIGEWRKALQPPEPPKVLVEPTPPQIRPIN